ncbi:MAG: HAD-IA family hydrolase [Nitrospinota bacterium]
MAELAAIIFDFDGTIADSEPLHLAAFQRTLEEELGLELTGKQYTERYLAFDDRQLFEVLLRDRGRTVPPGQFARLLEVKAGHYQRLAENPPLLPGAAEMIRRASARWPLAIASGALGREVRPVLERAGLLGCFSAIVTAEMVSRGKPDPESFTAALGRLNEKSRGGGIPPSSCLVAEDSLAGVAAARSAGMRVLAVTTSFGRAQLGEADRVVDSLEAAADPEALAAWFASLSPRA